jgi:hypothetical protein
MSDKIINIGAQGKVSPDPCTLSKSKDVLFCNNHEAEDYELIFDDPKGSPFEHVHYSVPAGAMHHRIGAAGNGKAGENYNYKSKVKGATAAADPVIIITK